MSTTPPLSTRTPPSGLCSNTTPTLTVSCGSRWTSGSRPFSRMFWHSQILPLGDDERHRGRRRLRPASPGSGRTRTSRPLRPGRRAAARAATARRDGGVAGARRTGSPAASAVGGLRGGMIEVGAAASAAPDRTAVAASAVSVGHAAPRGDALELGVHLLGRLEAVVRVLRERAEHDHVEVGRDVRTLHRRRPRRVREMLHRDLDRRLAAERRRPGQHLVEDDSDRVEVGALVDRCAPGLLGREVLRRPDDRARLGHLARRRRARSRSPSPSGARPRRP